MLNLHRKILKPTIFALENELDSLKPFLGNWGHQNHKISFLVNRSKPPLAYPEREKLSAEFDWVYYPAINRRAPLNHSEKNLGYLHDLAEYHFPQKYSLGRNILIKKILKRTAHNFSKIFVNSQSTRKDVIQYYGIPEEHICVNYLGIDQEFFAPLLQEEALQTIQSLNLNQKPFLLYVGRLEYPAKNHPFLIDLHERMCRHFPDLCLVFVGKKWTRWETVYHHMEQSTYRKQIYHLEGIPSQLKSTLPRCSCYIHPSLWEGFGYPVLGSIACKAPVLVFFTGSLARSRPDPEFHLIQQNSEEKINKIFSDTASRSDNREKSAFVPLQNFTLKAHFNRIYSKNL